MNWFDVVIALFVIHQTVNNARKGLLKNILELAALSVSIALSVILFQPIGQIFRTIFFRVPDFIAQVLSFTGLWLGAYLILLMLADLLLKIWCTTFLWRVDTILGGAFGFFKGTILVALTFFVLIVFSYFSVLPKFLDNGYRQSIIFKNTSSYLNAAALIMNEWLLAGSGEKPSVLNQIKNLLMKNEIPRDINNEAADKIQNSGLKILDETRKAAEYLQNSTEQK